MSSVSLRVQLPWSWQCDRLVLWGGSEELRKCAESLDTEKGSYSGHWLAARSGVTGWLRRRQTHRVARCILWKGGFIPWPQQRAHVCYGGRVGIFCKVVRGRDGDIAFVYGVHVM
jgi:hypothetical protein